MYKVTYAEPRMPLQRGLRASLYKGALPPDQFGGPTSRTAFAVAVLAVIVEFCISGNTLAALGFSDGQPGGNPFLKFVPGTYLALLGATIAILGGPTPGRRASFLFSRAPALVLFVVLMSVCIIFAVINVGITGIGVYVDTYLSAAGIAVVMANASDRQRAILARLILGLCAVNVFIALAEYIHQDHFIPLQVASKDVTDSQTEEFRPAALYGHPLTGAMATSFAVFLTL